MSRGEAVSTDVLMRLCEYLDCNVGDIMSFEKNDKPDIFDGGKSNG